MIPFIHLPTVLLVIGYGVYWLELAILLHPTGHTTWFASALFLVYAAVLAFRHMKACSFRFKPICFPRLSWENGFWLLCGLFALVIIGVVFYASLLPPHLPQEFDAINYHITVPRQHLLTGSFAHLPWSWADFFLSPIDFAFTPYWLVTELPNKFPQFFFFAALPLLAVSLARRAGAQQPWLAAVLILGLHGLMIQGGTAMLDIVLCYLCIAAIEAFLAGHSILAAIEAGFFVFGKPMLPIFAALLVLGMLLIVLLVRPKRWLLGFKAGESGVGDWRPRARAFLVSFAVAGLVCAGPFMLKSFFYTGTPFFPVGVGIFKPIITPAPGFQEKMKAVSDQYISTRNTYGLPRNAGNFLAHFWLIAVPDKGVNNRFDYPLGLPIVLMIGPFVFFLTRAIGCKQFPVLPVLCVASWILWWFGSQQSRFLFVPAVLMMVTTVAMLDKGSRILRGCLVVACGFTAMSVCRAHAADFGKTSLQVLRQEDRMLVDRAANVQPGARVAVYSSNMAFAAFVVDVRAGDSMFVIKQ
ncbi:MAG: hypothetical protein HQL19_01930 [Candidatus Omnitrophica bacterium]|nr:hypothetical protein [Candidatus Omnitrophota bacterium]